LKRWPIFALLFVFSIQLHAQDTTGCSPLKTKVQGQNTFWDYRLDVSISHPFSEECWNAEQSGFEISYYWIEKSAPVQMPEVKFWLLFNQDEMVLNAHVNCIPVEVLNYGHNPAEKRPYKCTASVRVNTGFQDAWEVEIAPNIDGRWDTRGFRQNYFFSF
jgi:hypothetical protein